jgi:hypothetical protein
MGVRALRRRKTQANHSFSEKNGTCHGGEM